MFFLDNLGFLLKKNLHFLITLIIIIFLMMILNIFWLDGFILKEKVFLFNLESLFPSLKVGAEMCFMLLFLLQDLSNNIFFNAVKGKVFFSFSGFFLITIFCLKLLITPYIVQLFHHWRLDWAAHCKIRSSMILMTIRNPVLHHLLKTLLRCLVLLKDVYPWIDGMSLIPSLQK